MRSIPVVFVLLLGLWPAAARAQQSLPSPEMPPTQWTHGPELDVHVGAATSASVTNAMFGGAVQWDVTPWFAAEGRGSWFDRGTDASAFSVDATALLNLVRKQTATPYVGAGLGIYRASFGPTASMPSFYRDRVTANAAGSTNTFTDPMLRFVFGVDIGGIPSESHWIVRPEVAALVVFGNGTNETMFTATVSIGYQFRTFDRGADAGYSSIRENK
jgi:hypothetical protein